MRSGIDVGQEGLARNLRSGSSQRCLIGLRSELFEDQSNSSTPNSPNHVLMGLALYTGAQSCWNIKRAFPKLFPQSWKPDLSQMSWYAEVLRSPFTPEKQAPSSTKLYRWQVTLSWHPPKPRPVHQAARQRHLIRHSTEYVSTTTESSGSVLYTNPSDTWHCA